MYSNGPLTTTLQILSDPIINQTIGSSVCFVCFISSLTWVTHSVINTSKSLFFHEAQFVVVSIPCLELGKPNSCPGFYVGLERKCKNQKNFLKVLPQVTRFSPISLVLFTNHVPVCEEY